ncbi:MAG: ribbon-helix-helix protein, CopG family [Gemmatimonadales bacterium]
MPVRRPAARPLLPGNVDVEPKGGGPVTVAANSSNNYVSFTVDNNRAYATTYTPTCAGMGVVTACTSLTEILTMDAYETDTVRVRFDVTGTSGTGQVSLAAHGVVSDSGWYDVTIGTPPPPPNPVLTQPRQPDSVFNRAHCLTSSVGHADWSCGDALLMLATPTFTTLDRARNLTLVYASSAAAPRPLVAVNVGLDTTTLVHVTAQLTVNDTVRTTTTYTPWTSNVRQLVVGWDASAAPTGAYPYTLMIRGVRSSDSSRGPDLVQGAWREYLIYVTRHSNLTHMEKTQVYLRKEELAALRKAAARSGQSIAHLVREAIREVVLKPASAGPVAIWNGEPKRSSTDHDSVHDQP